MLMKRQLFLAGISLMLGGMPMLAQDISPVNSVSYEWKSVPIVGGGFVDGIVFHPEAPGVRYLPHRYGRSLSVGRCFQPMDAFAGLDKSG